MENKKILHIATLEQISNTEYPWEITVCQYLHKDGAITFSAELRHERFFRNYRVTGIVWNNALAFTRWLKKIINSFGYDNTRYPIELFAKDINYAETWYERHFMRKRETLPVANIV